MIKSGRFARAGVVVVVMMPVVTACGIADTASRDLCTQYQQFVASADALRQLDPSTASADEVEAKVADVRARLNQVAATADGRLDTAVSNLRSALVDLEQSAVTASAEGYTVARPMVQESLTEVKVRFAALQQAAASECPASG